MSQYKIGHRTINEKLFRGKLADLISFGQILMQAFGANCHLGKLAQFKYLLPSRANSDGLRKTQ